MNEVSPLERIFGREYIEFLKKVKRKRRMLAYTVNSDGIVKKYKLSDNADIPKLFGLVTNDGDVVFAVGSESENGEDYEEIQGHRFTNYIDKELHSIVLKYLKKGGLLNVENKEFTWKISNTELYALLIHTGSDLYERTFESGDYRIAGFSEDGLVGIVIPSYLKDLFQPLIRPSDTYFIVGVKREREYEGKKYIDYRVYGLWQ